MLVYRLSAPTSSTKIRDKEGDGDEGKGDRVDRGDVDKRRCPSPLFGDGFGKVDMSSYRKHSRELVGLIRL